MHSVFHRARLDWLAEMAGASAIALAVGYAGVKLAPVLALSLAAVVIVTGVAGTAAALVMRAVPAATRGHPLPTFALPPIEADELLLDCPVELLLDEACQVPLLLTDELMDDALLLDDPLVQARSNSRVVQLFASPPLLPTPGELKDRIDRHLATGAMHVVREVDGPASDASDALYAALNELRRSLR